MWLCASLVACGRVVLGTGHRQSLLMKSLHFCRTPHRNRPIKRRALSLYLHARPACHRRSRPLKAQLAELQRHGTQCGPRLERNHPRALHRAAQRDRRPPRSPVHVDGRKVLLMLRGAPPEAEMFTLIIFGNLGQRLMAGRQGGGPPGWQRGMGRRRRSWGRGAAGGRGAPRAGRRAAATARLPRDTCSRRQALARRRAAQGRRRRRGGRGTRARP
jgi:hypothetical protein